MHRQQQALPHVHARNIAKRHSIGDRAPIPHHHHHHYYHQQCTHVDAFVQGSTSGRRCVQDVNGRGERLRHDDAGVFVVVRRRCWKRVGHRGYCAVGCRRRVELDARSMPCVEPTLLSVCSRSERITDGNGTPASLFPADNDVLRFE